MKFLHILAISVLAPICGIAVFLASDVLFPEARTSSPWDLWAVVLALFWGYAASISLLLGLLLHLLVANLRVTPSVIFLLFFTASAAVTWLLFHLLPGITHHIFALGIGTGVAAWFMYCFGPLKLWRPRAREA